LEGFALPRTVAAIRHVEFEDLGFFEAPLIADGYEVRYHDAAIDDPDTIDPADAALIVVLGGPMGVYEADIHPFLDAELRLIRERAALGKPILGICLGAQLIAHALGARVYPGPVKEIGLSPIALTEAGRSSPLSAVAPEQPVLHWHGDTFDLPKGATLLASSDAYPNQAFAVGRNVLALQFHLEAGAGIERWITGHHAELSSAGIDDEALRRDVVDAVPALRQVAAQVLAEWLSRTDN
jgi:GMP synthase (glutamine-hydrolysing)